MGFQLLGGQGTSVYHPKKIPIPLSVIAQKREWSSCKNLVQGLGLRVVPKPNLLGLSQGVFYPRPRA